jgi:hypothetical protein
VTWTPSAALVLLLLCMQAQRGVSLLHNNLHQFLRAHSHSAKRLMWTPAGTAAGITAFAGTTATMRVRSCTRLCRQSDNRITLLTAAVALYWHCWRSTAACILIATRRLHAYRRSPATAAAAVTCLHACTGGAFKLQTGAIFQTHVDVIFEMQAGSSRLTTVLTMLRFTLCAGT